MDYTKLKKDELLELLQSNEEVVEKAKFYQDEYLAAKKLKDEAVKESFDSKKKIKELEDKIEKLVKEHKENEALEIKTLRMELDGKEKEMVVQNKKFNESYKQIKTAYEEMSKLFNEYILAFDDQHTLYKVMVRNTENTMALLKSKVNKFNQEGDEQK
jgi:hypothetical protein